MSFLLSCAKDSHHFSLPSNADDYDSCCPTSLEIRNASHYFVLIPSSPHLDVLQVHHDRLLSAQQRGRVGQQRVQNAEVSSGDGTPTHDGLLVRLDSLQQRENSPHRWPERLPYDCSITMIPPSLISTHQSNEQHQPTALTTEYPEGHGTEPVSMMMLSGIAHSPARFHKLDME